MSGKIVSVKHKGDFKNTEKFLKRMEKRDHLNDLNRYGQLGVSALIAATPRDTGRTASSWGYTIEQSAEYTKIIWTNSNIQDGANIAVILNTGHGTGQGYWVEGRDYINPAMQPVFDEIAEGAWKGVVI